MKFAKRWILAAVFTPLIWGAGYWAGASRFFSRSASVASGEAILYKSPFRSQADFSILSNRPGTKSESGAGAESTRESAAPDKEAELAAALPPGNWRNRSIREALARWALIDPRAAFDWSEGLSPGAVREAAHEGVFTAWANRDPSAAFAFARSELAEGDRRAALELILGNWLRFSPADALTHAALIRSVDKREDIRRDLYLKWAGDDPKAVIGHLRSLAPDADDRCYLPAAMGVLATKDPLAAVDMASALPEGEQRTAAVKTLVGVLQADDPALAASLALALPEGSDRSDALGEVASYYAASDLDEAMVWWAKLDEGEGKDAALNGLVISISRLGGDDIARYASRLPDGEWKKNLVREAAEKKAAAIPY